MLISIFGLRPVVDHNYDIDGFYIRKIIDFETEQPDNFILHDFITKLTRFWVKLIENVKKNAK